MLQRPDDDLALICPAAMPVLNSCRRARTPS